MVVDSLLICCFHCVGLCLYVRLKYVSVLWLFHTVPWVGMQCVIVIFPDHTYLFFLSGINKTER